MDIEKQIQLIRTTYLSLLDEIYNPQFLIRLTVLRGMDQKWYDNKLSVIERLCALIEDSVMGANPRRAVRYICALSKYIGLIVQTVNKDYHSNLEKKLIS